MQAGCGRAGFRRRSGKNFGSIGGGRNRKQWDNFEVYNLNVALSCQVVPMAE